MFEQLIDLDQQLLLTLNGSDSLWLDRVFLLITKTGTWLPLAAILVWLLARQQSWRQTLLTIVGVALVVLIADRFSSGFCKPFFHRFRPSHEPLLEGLVDLVDDRRGGLYGFISSHAANTFGVATFLALVLTRSFRRPSDPSPVTPVKGGSWLARCFRTIARLSPSQQSGEKVFVSRPSRLRFSLIATLLCWACLSSYSRIYLGLHYPGDILCGALFGVLTGYACYRLYAYLLPRLVPSLPSPDGSASALAAQASAQPHSSSLALRPFDVYLFVAAFWLTVLTILLAAL